MLTQQIETKIIRVPEPKKSLDPAEKMLFTAYKKAADAGDIEAQYLVGCCYLFALGTHANIHKAKEYLLLAANGGDAEAKLGNEKAREVAGNAYARIMDVFSILKKPQEIFRYSKQGALQGHAAAMLQLGTCFYKGEGTTKNLHHAMEYFIQASEIEFDEGVEQIALLFANESCFLKDIARIMPYLQKGAARNNCNALMTLGNSFFNGYGVKIDYEKALNCFAAATRSGESKAYYNYGLILASSPPPHKDIPQTIYWLEKAAKLDCNQAKLQLAELYEQGIEIPKNTAKAVKLRKEVEDLKFFKRKFLVNYKIINVDVTKHFIVPINTYNAAKKKLHTLDLLHINKLAKEKDSDAIQIMELIHREGLTQNVKDIITYWQVKDRARTTFKTSLDLALVEKKPLKKPKQIDPIKLTHKYLDIDDQKTNHQFMQSLDYTLLSDDQRRDLEESKQVFALRAERKSVSIKIDKDLDKQVLELNKNIGKTKDLATRARYYAQRALLNVLRQNVPQAVRDIFENVVYSKELGSIAKTDSFILAVANIVRAENFDLKRAQRIALATLPTDSNHYLVLALLSLKSGAIDNAIEMLKKALTPEPELGEILSYVIEEYTVTLCKRGEVAKALVDLKLLQTQPLSGKKISHLIQHHSEKKISLVEEVKAIAKPARKKKKSKKKVKPSEVIMTQTMSCATAPVEEKAQFEFSLPGLADEVLVILAKLTNKDVLICGGVNRRYAELALGMRKEIPPVTDIDFVIGEHILFQNLYDILVQENFPAPFQPDVKKSFYQLRFPNGLKIDIYTDVELVQDPAKGIFKRDQTVNGLIARRVHNKNHYRIEDPSGRALKDIAANITHPLTPPSTWADKAIQENDPSYWVRSFRLCRLIAENYHFESAQTSEYKTFLARLAEPLQNLTLVKYFESHLRKLILSGVSANYIKIMFDTGLLMTLFPYLEGQLEKEGVNYKWLIDKFSYIDILFKENKNDLVKLPYLVRYAYSLLIAVAISPEASPLNIDKNIKEIIRKSPIFMREFGMCTSNKTGTSYLLIKQEISLRKITVNFKEEADPFLLVAHSFLTSKKTVAVSEEKVMQDDNKISTTRP